MKPITQFPLQLESRYLDLERVRAFLLRLVVDLSYLMKGFS
jgi:hypothetical protein